MYRSSGGIHVVQDGRSPCRVDRSNVDRSVLRIRARPSQRWHINRALYSRVSRLRWQQIACVPLRGQTCEHGESDCVYYFSGYREGGREGNRQEGCVVVRGRRGTIWRAVEALVAQGPFEDVEGRGRHGRTGVVAGQPKRPRSEMDKTKRDARDGISCLSPFPSFYLPPPLP